MRRVGTAVVGSLVLALSVVAVALAAAAPVITAGPTVTGVAQAGGTVTATATFTGDPAPATQYTWMRCGKITGPCSNIAGATAQDYSPTASDVNFVLRVRLRVTNGAGTAEERSGPSAPVLPAGPPLPGTPPPVPTPAPTATPGATPTPTPTPTATPTGSGTGTSAGSGTAAPQPGFDLSPTVVAPSAPLSPTAPQRLDPFPIVRIKGVLTPRGARVTLFSVRALKGAKVMVVCRGTGCPVRRLGPSTRLRRLQRLEHELRAGTRLEVRVTKTGFIGKYTVIVIRRGAAPKRTDRCLTAGAQRVVRCAGA